MSSTKISAIGLNLAEFKREHQAQQEIDTFLKAISSYPESFAHNPNLSFEEHLFTITAQSQELHLA
jgi:hypothetical protein